MAKYHVNPATGEAGACRARKSCPFGDLATEHYVSPEAARAAYEKAMESSTVSAPRRQDAAPQLVPDTYDFPAYRLEEAVKRVEQANRRAEKAGLSERFSYTIDRYEDKRIQDGLTLVEERIKFTLDRPSVQHQGWNFVGTMSWDPEVGLVTRMVPGENLLERPEAEKCDVCKTTRHRSDTYIVQRGDEQLQVGSACLERFLGIKPSGLWMLDFELPEQVEATVLPGSVPWKDRRQDSVEMLALGLAAVKSKGWLSRSKAQELGELATADRVLDLLASSGTQKQQMARAEIIGESQALMGEAREILEVARTMEGDSEYAENLRAVASAESVTVRNLPLLLSAIAVRERQRRDAAALEEKKVSRWVGQKGEKVPEQVVTIEQARWTNSQFGSSLLLTMVDSEGNRYKTFYGGSAEPKVGESYTLAGGKVKEHEEWRGVKETMLGRVKLASVRPDSLPPTRLPASSPYVQAWTPEENAKLNDAEHRKILRAIKKEAGPDGWDQTWSRPKDPALTRKLEELERATNLEFHARYRELMGEEPVDPPETPRVPPPRAMG